MAEFEFPSEKVQWGLVCGDGLGVTQNAAWQIQGVAQDGEPQVP